MPDSDAAVTTTPALSPSADPGLLAPVAPGERIDGLDLLRGWAMFGVLWSNLNSDYITIDAVSKFDKALEWTQWNLIQDHFYSLLILLFGVGFGVQLLRADDRGVDVRNTYYRRSAALLLIGIIHGTLIWHGDILTIYALVSFALVLFRRSTNRALIIWAAVFWFIVPQIVREGMFLSGLRVMINTNVHVGGSEGVATWLQIEHARIAQYMRWLGRWGLSLYPSILASFLIGMWTLKSGYFRRVAEQPKATLKLLGIAVAAIVVGYLCNTYAAKVWPLPKPLPPSVEPQAPYWGFHLVMLRQVVVRLFQWKTLGETIAYACVMLLLWQRPLGSRLLRPLANAGRMALTTYLAQSVVATLLFYSYGLGLMGKVNFTGVFFITLGLFVCQMAFATWWLKRYRFGPMEWVWRTMTYGRAPSMRV